MAQIKSIFKLPRIAPRAGEIKELAEEIDGGKFKDAAAMARKAMALAFGFMADRSWFVVASRLDGGPVTLYGLFATEAAAMKALEENTLGLFGQAGIYEVRSLTGRADYLDAQEDALWKDCATCGHVEAAHHWPRSKVSGCVIAECGCHEYVRPPRPIQRVSAA
ncbi:hypothetical protein [Cellulomonas sp. SG140]|uniref:hypothetical protein n=1 Tax=Cellulomonas sp. SG140 TaxID=2976536 RepID=UPI0021E70C8D|nr:hypothetical protein [Cellulomonas sp. SG140]